MRAVVSASVVRSFMFTPVFLANLVFFPVMRSIAFANFAIALITLSA